MYWYNVNEYSCPSKERPLFWKPEEHVSIMNCQFLIYFLCFSLIFLFWTFLISIHSQHIFQAPEAFVEEIMCRWSDFNWFLQKLLKPHQYANLVLYLNYLWDDHKLPVRSCHFMLTFGTLFLSLLRPRCAHFKQIPLFLHCNRVIHTHTQKKLILHQIVFFWWQS